MTALQLTDEQVLDVIKKLSPEQKRNALLALAQDAQATRQTRMRYAEAQFRRLAAERGLDWDTMTEDEREAFSDDLIHEDRACAS